MLQKKLLAPFAILLDAIIFVQQIRPRHFQTCRCREQNTSKPSPAFLHKHFLLKGMEGQKTYNTFAMRHWEKNKKELRRTEDRDLRQQSQDHKKKKLKPVEKTKYRTRSLDDFEE